MPLTRRKRRKRNSKKDINGRPRRLNDLPKNVVSHILSFLPTEEAVRTSVLSRKWEFLWTRIPELGFDQGNSRTRDFVDFVRRALALRRLSYRITKFQLAGKMESSRSVEMVISSVADDVEELGLHLENLKKPLTLPLSLLDSATLTRLHIRMKGQKLMLPFLMIQLPSLKQLNLRGIIFPNEYSAQNLFYGCPSLEDLQLVDCKWPQDVKTVKVLCPKLQKLSIDEAHDDDDDDGERNGQNKPEFVILGSALRHCNYLGLFYFDYYVMNPAVLEEVNINTYDDSSHHHHNRVLIASLLLRLLRSVSHAPKLVN